MGQGWLLRPISPQLFLLMFPPNFMPILIISQPEELKDDYEKSLAGDWYWVKHPTEAYVPARVLSRSGDSVDLQTDSGEHIKAKASDLHGKIPSASYLRGTTDDLVQMDEVHVPSIIHNNIF